MIQSRCNRQPRSTAWFKLFCGAWHCSRRNSGLFLLFYDCKLHTRNIVQVAASEKHALTKAPVIMKNDGIFNPTWLVFTEVTESILHRP
ncbi:hypothetical protein GJAV_G00043600 [Gymnothorax javanicus]|nr:hypothetical protein GJAV_G00043600 [Gymnothorax javanicus]